MIYVLVHGAWHGGWCWERVRFELESEGHVVYTPSLTGLSGSAVPLSPDVGIETHVNDIQELLENEKLTDVILVGHSYAGAIVTVLADRARQRLKRIVYLDALIPKSGHCLLDLFDADYCELIRSRVNEFGDGWKMPVAKKEAFGLEKEEDILWVMPKLVPHPFKTYQDIILFNTAHTASMLKSYIKCIGNNPPDGKRTPYAEGINDYYELATGHDAMITAPQELVQLLKIISACK